jgi:hypothetical protein
LGVRVIFCVFLRKKMGVVVKGVFGVFAGVFEGGLEKTW